MFTGLVSDVGRVVEIQKSADGARLVIDTAYDVSTIDIGRLHINCWRLSHCRRDEAWPCLLR